MSVLFKFLNDTAGNISVLFALCAIIIFGAAGLALDFWVWNKQRASMQEAVDAGALAGARFFAIDTTAGAGAIEDHSKEYALSSLDASTSGSIVTASVNSELQEVTVNARLPGKQYFSALIARKSTELSVNAKSKAFVSEAACMIALNETDSGTFSSTGSVDVRLTNCGLQVDSGHANGMTETGASDIRADSISVAGGYSGNGYTPMPTTGVAPIGDPFKHIAIPTAGACDHNNFSTNTDTTISEGVYCGGISVSSAAIDMEPGTYFIVDGDFEVFGNASVDGAGVTLVLVGTATLQMTGNGHVHLSPPMAGPLKGFSIVQDRSAPAGNISMMKGTGDLVVSGAVYLPKSTLQITGSGGGTAANPDFVSIVADKVDIVGAASINVRVDGGSLSQSFMSNLKNWRVILIQ